MSDPSDRCARIEAELRERLAAVHVEVVDESHLHVGHAGARDGGGHFRAIVVSMRFEGKALHQGQYSSRAATAGGSGSVMDQRDAATNV